MKDTAKHRNFKGQCAPLDSPRKEHNTSNPASKVYSHTGMQSDWSAGNEEFHRDSWGGLSPTHEAQTQHRAHLEPPKDDFPNVELRILFIVLRDGCSSDGANHSTKTIREA